MEPARTQIDQTYVDLQIQHGNIQIQKNCVCPNGGKKRPNDEKKRIICTRNLEIRKTANGNQSLFFRLQHQKKSRSYDKQQISQAMLRPRRLRAVPASLLPAMSMDLSVVVVVRVVNIVCCCRRHSRQQRQQQQEKQEQQQQQQQPQHILFNCRHR